MWRAVGGGVQPPAAVADAAAAAQLARAGACQPQAQLMMHNLLCNNIRDIEIDDEGMMLALMGSLVSCMHILGRSRQ